MKKLLLVTLAMFASSSIYAAESIDWSSCSKEVKEYQCKGADKDVWSCLEKHDDDLSPSCQKVHEKADDLFKKK